MEYQTQTQQQPDAEDEPEETAATPETSDDADRIDGMLIPAATLETLRAMNERHALVLFGGRTRFLDMIDNPRINEPPYQLLEAQAFRDYYLDHQVSLLKWNKKQEAWLPVLKNAGWAWERWSGRRSYRRAGFCPNGTTPADTFNMWEGWRYQAHPGSWQKLKRHIYEVVCDRDPDKFRWLMDHLTHVVQTTGDPGRRSPTSPVVWGKKGSGKSLVFDLFAELFGNHGITVSHKDQLIGKFNKHLMLSVYVVAEEAVYAHDRQGEGPLKDLLTRKTLTIEPKGVDMFSSPNYCRFAFISNDELAVPMTGDERRYQPFEASDHRIGNQAYFSAIMAEWETGGREAMLYDLMQRRYDADRIRMPLHTSVDLAEMQARTLSPVIQFALTWFAVGHVTLTKTQYGAADFAEPCPLGKVLSGNAHYLNLKKDESETPSAVIKKAYDLWCEESLDQYERKRATRNTEVLIKELLEALPFLQRYRTAKARGIRIPSADTCRQHIWEHPVYRAYIREIGADQDWADSVTPEPPSREAPSWWP